MKSTKPSRRIGIVTALACAAMLTLPSASAQVTKVLFFEDFDGDSIDPEKLQPDAPFFEGGQGDISAELVGGEVQFTGEVTEQWWAGATLRIVPTFEATVENDIVVSVDRVEEAGVGTASRSALWILDETQTKYVLFADVRGEEGWRYNRKIGQAGDQPTGGGVIITAFDGPDWDDQGPHRMKAVANGQTVKLYLDDVLGAEVAFPFDKYVFHIGSYARATGDFADTTFDDLRVESVGVAVFGETQLTLTSGQTSSEIIVSIPEGANADADVVLSVISGDPSVAVPVGGTGGTLTLTYAEGTPRTQTIQVESAGEIGGATFTLENDIGMGDGNQLQVTVIEGPGIRLEDDFSGSSLDTSKWAVNDLGFEDGDGVFEVEQSGGNLEIFGYTLVDFWPGASIKTVQSFTATKDLALVMEVDRVSVANVFDDITSTAVRTGVYVTTDDRSQYVFFGQNVGETGWQVNVSPGNPTGGGTGLVSLSDENDNLESVTMKLIADGENVDVFLNDAYGGTFPFAVSSGIHFEVGAYARAFNDEVIGVFDNVKVENTLPCVTVAPTDVWNLLGAAGDEITVTIPSLLNATQPATVTVTSSAPEVAIPEGAVDGTLTLTFPQGAPNTQTFAVAAKAPGTATFTLASEEGVCIAGEVSILITAQPQAVFTDDFASGEVDPAKWSQNDTALDETTPGTSTEDSTVGVVTEEVVMDITALTAEWPGYALTTVETYEASTEKPVVFEIDRVKLDFVLVNGTSAKQRTGVWVTDTTRSQYLFFGEYATHDATIGGWQYNLTSADGANLPLPGAGASMAAFNEGVFNDRGNHRVKVAVDGATARLYVDDLLGATVPFTLSTDLVFGFGTYVQQANDIVTGTFDNATVSIPGDEVPAGELSASLEAGGDVVVSWTGAGVLQSAEALGDSSAWADVTPPPTGNSYTIPAGSLGTQAYYRLRN